MPQCAICSKNYTLNKNLYQHLRKVHKITPHIPGSIICPVCNIETFRSHKELRAHLSCLHSANLENEELKFPDNETFEIWKKRYEEETGYIYVCRISEKSLKKLEAKTHYICNRSGIFKSESKGHRKLKKDGSNKIGATCPSIMQVSRSLLDGKISVIFWKTHFGHEAKVNQKSKHKKSRLKNSDLITYPVCAILPAAGTGERMGLEIPKQFISIHQKPLICYAVEAFLKISFIQKVIVVASSKNLSLMLKTLSQMCALKGTKLMVTEGASTRHQSIDSGLKAIQNCCDFKPEVVIVHDGVRPFFPEEILNDVVIAAKEYGAAGITCPLVSTVLSVDDSGYLTDVLNRNKFKASEMPQAFQYDLLCKAYAECSSYDMEQGTECLQLILKYTNIKPKLIPATSILWKVTYKKDIYAASGVIKEHQKVGIIKEKTVSEFLPFLTCSLNKRFKFVEEIKKHSDDSFIDAFPNLIKLYDQKNINAFLNSQNNEWNKTQSSTQLKTVVYIFFHSFEEQMNLLELQKQSKIIASKLNTYNRVLYFIIPEEYGSQDNFKKLAEMVSSLLFDSNPHLNGHIFFV